MISACIFLKAGRSFSILGEEILPPEYHPTNLGEEIPISEYLPPDFRRFFKLTV